MNMWMARRCRVVIYGCDQLCSIAGLSYAVGMRDCMNSSTVLSHYRRRRDCTDRPSRSERGTRHCISRTSRRRLLQDAIDACGRARLMRLVLEMIVEIGAACQRIFGQAEIPGTRGSRRRHLLTGINPVGVRSRVVMVGISVQGKQETRAVWRMCCN